MGPNIAMVAGALLWLAGELWGVFHAGPQKDTTTDWVRWAELKWPLVRVLVGVFVLSLFGHFMWGGALLP